MADDAVTAMVLATRAPVLLAPSMNVNMWNHPLTRANLQQARRRREVQGRRPGRWLPRVPVDRSGPARRARGHRRGRGDAAVAAGPRRQEARRQRRPDVRSDRSGPLRRQSQLRQDGHRARGRRQAPRRRRDADPRAERGAAADRRDHEPRRDRGAAAVGAREREQGRRRDHHDRRGRRLPAGARGEREAQARRARCEDIRSSSSRTRTCSPSSARQRKGKTPLLVGFAAETEDVIDNARKKLASKKCDLIVANDVSEPNAGFAVDTNHVQLVDDDEVIDVPPAPKTEVAHRILDKIVAMLGGAGGREARQARKASRRSPPRR